MISRNFFFLLFIIISGMFVLNLACRDPLLRSEVIQDIHRVFQTVWSYKVPEEVNEILFCTDQEWPNAKKISKKHPAVEAFGQVNSHITKRIIKDGKRNIKTLNLMMFSQKKVSYCNFHILCSKKKILHVDFFSCYIFFFRHDWRQIKS